MGAPPPETCGDRVDGDGDGADDYADPDCAADEAFAAALQGIVEDARGPVGALVLGVERADRRVALAASGVAEKGGDRAVTPVDRFPIGSATKSFVATVVMQLRDEGALSLDDPLARWLPAFPRAERIRVRHLLGHTSGVFDYTQDDGFTDLVLADHRFTPDEMTAIAAAHDPLFEPGAGWSYSNSNYILLGQVIEAVTGHAAAAELRARILEPLNMADSFLLGSEEGALEVHGYLDQAGPDLDFTAHWNGTAAWTAGALVSTAPDLLRFVHGLAAGELVAPETLAEMTTPVARLGGDLGYGYGLLVGPDWYGHDGAVFGWMAEWLHFSDGTVVAALQNRLDDGAAMQAATDAVLAL